MKTYKFTTDYDLACHNTGKIIVAKITNSSGETVRELYGKAIAEPIFKGLVYYRMPKEMEERTRYYSSDKKIYVYGGIEDGPREIKPSCKDNQKARFWFNHFTPNDLLLDMMSGSDEEGKNERYELILEVVTPIC